MATQNYGQIIRRAREMAGLTQEQLSEGICEPLSLSRIETNAAGVSPETFQILMERTGNSCSITPEFENRAAYDTYVQLDEAEFYIEMGHLDQAYQVLQTAAKNQEYFRNPYRYQRIQLDYVCLVLKGSECDYRELAQIAIDTLCISIPNFQPEVFPVQLLSVMEIRILLSLSEIYLHTGKELLCQEYCDRLEEYLLRAGNSYERKNYFMAQITMLRARAAMQLRQSVNGHLCALREMHRTCVQNQIVDVWVELYACIGACLYFAGDREPAIEHLKTACMVGRAFDHVIAGVLFDWGQKELGVELLPKEEAECLPRAKKWELISLLPYEKGAEEEQEFLYKIGDIIHDNRIEQKLTMEQLCQGLCAKSTLSKIENGVMMPKRYLCGGLLERLGLNGDLFYFYCNGDEFENYELQKKCVNYMNENTEEGDRQAGELIELIEQKYASRDVMTRQFCYGKKALLLLRDSGESIQSAMEYTRNGIFSTVKDFNEADLARYCLHQEEIVLIRDYIYEYVCNGQRIHAIQLLYKMLEYYENKTYMMREKVRSWPLILILLLRLLYLEGRYAEVRELEKLIVLPETLHEIDCLQQVYLYYSQALGELGIKEKALKYGRYTYALYRIENRFEFAEVVARDFKNDFGLDIHYT